MLRTRAVGAATAALLIVAACGGDDPAPVGDPTTAPVATAAPTTTASPGPSAGATIVSGDGSASLVLAEGALPDGVTADHIEVVLEPDAITPPDGIDAVTRYRLEPDGLQLARPATLTFAAPTGAGSPFLALHVSGSDVAFPEIQQVEPGTYRVDLDHFSTLDLWWELRASDAEGDLDVTVTRSGPDPVPLDLEFTITAAPHFPDEIIAPINPVPLRPTRRIEVFNIRTQSAGAGAKWRIDRDVIEHLGDAELTRVVRRVNPRENLFDVGPAGLSERFICVQQGVTTVEVVAHVPVTFDWTILDADNTVVASRNGTSAFWYPKGTIEVTCAPAVDRDDPSKTPDSAPPATTGLPGTTEVDVSFLIDGTECSARFTLDESGGTAHATASVSCSASLQGMGVALGYRCTAGNTLEFFEQFLQDTAELEASGDRDTREDCPVEAQVGVFGQEVTVLTGPVNRILETGPGRNLVVDIRD